MDTNANLVTASVMARRLRVPARWLVEEAGAGRIPHVQAGRVVLFHPQTVESVLIRRAQQQAGGEEAE